MIYTTQAVVSNVYALLRDPAQERLYYEDVHSRLNSRLEGYVRDMELAGRDHRTVTSEVEVAEDDIDFLMRVPEAPDFEAVKLEYLGASGAAAGGWRRATLVPFSAFEQNRDSGGVVASIYGSYALREGQKLKLNLCPADAALLSFRLSYRLPLLTLVQMGLRPPLPSGHMPMLEYDTALDSIDIVRDDSARWVAWVERTTPKYEKRSEEEHARWRAYLESSVEDQVQPLARSDAHRMRARGATPRAYVPRG